ncbi:MAG: hypothetical protein J4478_04310 [Candidatus Diapherotrites archaeon]|uniref:Copper resistance protein D domain-containing protein n=2 Tax=Candidatus Iainarchaeum sp. TaxID=3101447 RepID=A0A7J4KSR1_9ARCH|nr:hypothetical protein [Candidatus Diapherotrites archaeon]HIH32734.1 hypothetical protein [Candidatus Diapherotrites archaeon]
MSLEFSILQLLHIVFTAWGLGGATVAAVLMLKAKKDQSMGQALLKVMAPISKLIWLGLIGLIITGIAISALGSGKGYFDATTLLAKHVIVILLLIFGLNISLRLLPRLKALAPKAGEKPSHKFLQVSKTLALNSTLSLFLWYVITALSAAL